MIQIGIARTDITPAGPVWMSGFGFRDRKSDDVYRPLKAGAIAMSGNDDDVLILTADIVGYGAEYTEAVRARIGAATGLAPRQIVLTATHTHSGPFFWPMAMPGDVETGYAEFLMDRLLEVAVAARDTQYSGTVLFSRGRSHYGINRRLLNDDGVAEMRPNPNGPMDRDLDTLWFRNVGGDLLGTLTVYACHPTAFGDYRISGDYAGLLCEALEAETGAPAFFACGCAGDARSHFADDHANFVRPSTDEMEAASATMAREVLESETDVQTISAAGLRVDHIAHPLPYRDIATEAELQERASATGQEAGNGLIAKWAREMLSQLENGPLPEAGSHEIQLLRFNSNFNMLFLGGEILSEIGMRIKSELAPATTVVAAYSNGLLAYIPSKNAYPYGGYEVEDSYTYFFQPGPFTDAVEDLVLENTHILLRTVEDKAS